MYLVKQHFKAGGVFFPAGEVLTLEELHQMRLFRVRLNEGKVVDLASLTPEKRAALDDWMKIRHGVDVEELVKGKRSKGSEIAAKQAKAPTQPHPGTSEPVKQKPAETAKVATPPPTQKKAVTAQKKAE